MYWLCCYWMILMRWDLLKSFGDPIILINVNINTDWHQPFFIMKKVWEKICFF